MKKGIVIRAFSDNPHFLGGGAFLSGLDDFSRVFDRAAACGYDGVLREIAAAASRAGVEIPSLEIAPLQYSLTSDDDSERREGVRVIERSLSMAAELGAKGVLVIPGYVGLPWEKNGKTVQYDHAYLRTVEGLRSLTDHARAVGVTMYLENIGTCSCSARWRCAASWTRWAIRT